MAPRTTGGRMKGLAAGLELREATKKRKGSEDIPGISNGHLLVLVTKYCEITECPFSCFNPCFCRHLCTEGHQDLLS